jgi:hypothetical protein
VNVPCLLHNLGKGNVPSKSLIPDWLTRLQDITKKNVQQDLLLAQGPGFSDKYRPFPSRTLQFCCMCETLVLTVFQVKDAIK